MIKFIDFLESVEFEEPTHFVVGGRGGEFSVTFTREYKDDKGRIVSKTCPGQGFELNPVFLPGEKISTLYDNLKWKLIFDDTNRSRNKNVELIIPVNYQDWLIKNDPRFMGKVGGVDVITNLDPDIKKKYSHIFLGSKFGLLDDNS